MLAPEAAYADRLVAELAAATAQDPAPVALDLDGARLHQHGYAHVNHERSGRKHELARRSADMQAELIARGRHLCQDAFPPAITQRPH